MKCADQVGSVVHRDLGLVVKRLVEVAIVRLVVFPLDGEDRYAEILDHSGGGVVLVLNGLEAQRATSAPPALRVSIRLAVSVVTCRQADKRRPRSGFSLANCS